MCRRRALKDCHAAASGFCAGGAFLAFYVRRCADLRIVHEERGVGSGGWARWCGEARAETNTTRERQIWNNDKHWFVRYFHVLEFVHASHVSYVCKIVSGVTTVEENR